MGFAGDFMFSVIPVIMVVVFVFVFGTIIVRAVQGAKQYQKNNASPVLTVEATVVAKRADVSTTHHSHAGDTHVGMGHTSSSTTYYITFEVESGDRMEFHVQDHEYGMIVESDRGKLTFQGTRFKGFERV